MAILNSIRKRGIFLILIIAMALFAFILSDVLTRGGGSSVEDTVATVNGVDIDRTEFAQLVENTQKSMGPNASTSQAVNLVWDRELRRVLMEEQYEKLGLRVESEQINNALSVYLANDPTFQDENGNYSELKMLEYVADIKANAKVNPAPLENWENYIKNVKQTVLENTYLGMLRGGLTSTIAEGEQQYRFENDKIDIEFVHIPYTSIDDASITVSDEEIAAYIKANPKKFEVEPEVDFQYVLIEETASQEDIEAAEAEISALIDNRREMNNLSNKIDTILGFRETQNYQEYVNSHSDVPYTDRWYTKEQLPAAIKDTIFDLNEGDIYGPYQVDKTLNLTKVIEKRQLPDSARVRHILIPLGLNRTDSITRTDAQAKKTADSLLTILKGNKSKFATFVKQFSSDTGSIENDGVYDWFEYTKMVPAFRDYSFEQKTGDMGIVKTNFGYHIVEVLGQKDFKDVVKIATITKEIEPSEPTINEIFAEATTFEIEAAKGDFSEQAKALGLSVRPVNKVGKMDSQIQGIGTNRQIVNWAFNEETEVGDISRFNVSQGYVIVQLTRKDPKGLKSIAESSAEVTPILRNKKKAEQIMNRNSGKTMQEIATGENVTVQTASAMTMSAPTIPGAGNEPKVVGVAFGKDVGEETGLIEGKTGVFKVKVTAINKAPDLDNYAPYANELNAGVTQGLNSNVFKALKESADIEDNRAVFY
ncbi:peptidylprolyl isomerase [Pukyongia salina]|uniref:Periplasmic chaperone PpiD n=1 Tax=Pukyongia salina TaxID=2094025 RepID=A0A2S0HWR5_9FLAO|nr:SurA N-terminal domain-containing protein [Pukyongia salina]AVI51065.1 peptidylprolyl isomerase [Pukyongia salina]